MIPGRRTATVPVQCASLQILTNSTNTVTHHVSHITHHVSHIPASTICFLPLQTRCVSLCMPSAWAELPNPTLLQPACMCRPFDLNLLVCADPMRLFVHAICRNGWGDEEMGKGRVWKRYRLWLLDAAGVPLFNEDQEGGAHPFLPCAGLAWGGAV